MVNYKEAGVCLCACVRACVPAPGVRANGDGSKVASRWLH